MTEQQAEPVTEAGRETHTLLHRLSSQMKTCEMTPCPFMGLARRTEVEATEREAAAGSAEALQLPVAAVFQDHHPRGDARCECGWRPNLSPATSHHEHLMLRVLGVLGVTDD